MQARTFVVTVSDSPHRVVVEDVRSRRRTVATDLAEVGRQIASLLQAHPEDRDAPSEGAGPPVSKS